MHEEFIGAGVANLFIERMKLEGWLPIKEYFKMKKLGIELDWVMVLTMENDGFIAIPMVAEYRVPHKDSGRKSGWYKDEIDNPNRRIDDWTNVITEVSHVVQVRAEGPKAPSPGHRPGYNGNQQGAL